MSARLLADTAVQLVQAQIDTATSGSTTIAWVSQPGLIRTFDPASLYQLGGYDDYDSSAPPPGTEPSGGSDPDYIRQLQEALRQAQEAYNVRNQGD